MKLIIPTIEQLSYRKQLMLDPKTMSYNAHYDLDIPEYNVETGCILFDESKWETWYKKWIHNEAYYFYAYLQDDNDNFIGEINYHYLPEVDDVEIGIVIEAKYRGLGYSVEGLRLLINQAKQNGIKSLRNTFEPERVAALKSHLKVGFEIAQEKDDHGFITVVLDLTRE